MWEFVDKTRLRSSRLCNRSLLGVPSNKLVETPMKNIIFNIRVLMHNSIIWDYLFNNRRTRLVLVAIYCAMEKKFCNQHSLYPDVASAGFLKKCEIQRVHKHLFSNKVDIWLRRPGLMLGKAGCDIDWIQKYTGYKIILHESKHYANPVQEIVSKISYIACL